MESGVEISIPRGEPENLWGQGFAKRLLETYKGKNKKRTVLDSRFLGLPYFLYAWSRWGIREGVSRWWEFEGWPRLKGERLRRRYRRWKRRERRPKSYANSKTAINRDGDFYLVECPECHSQDIWCDRETWLFHCKYMHGRAFRVYTEDGVVKMLDHRDGDIPHFPTMAAHDPGANVWRLGLRKEDHPWWWTRRKVYRDLHGGKDAHGHRAYEPVEIPTGDGCDQCEAPAG